MNKESQELLVSAARWLVHAANGKVPLAIAVVMATRLTLAAVARVTV